MTRKAREAAGFAPLTPGAAFNLRTEFLLAFIQLSGVATRQAGRALKRAAKRAGISDETLAEMLETKLEAA
jgi:hypothetical protein